MSADERKWQPRSRSTRRASRCCMKPRSRRSSTSCFMHAVMSASAPDTGCTTMVSELTWPSQPCLCPRVYWTSQKNLDAQGKCTVTESSKEARTRRRRSQQHCQTLQNPEAAAVQSEPLSCLLHRAINPRIQPHADGGGYKRQSQGRARCLLAG